MNIQVLVQNGRFLHAPPYCGIDGKVIFDRIGVVGIGDVKGVKQRLMEGHHGFPTGDLMPPALIYQVGTFEPYVNEALIVTGHTSYIVRPHAAFSARKSGEGEIRRNLDSSEIKNLRGILKEFGAFYCYTPTRASIGKDGKINYKNAARAVNVPLTIDEMVLKNIVNGGIKNV